MSSGKKFEENLANSDLSAWQSLKIDPWLANRRWNIATAEESMDILIEDNLPGSIIAHALMSESYQQRLYAGYSPSSGACF